MQSNQPLIKILHLITGLSTGGAERALVRLIESSDRTRFEHHVISLIDKGTQGVLLDKMGVPVYALGMKGPLTFPMAIYKTRKIRQTIKPDVVHGWMYHGGLMALWAGSDIPKILGVRHSLHGLDNEKFLTRFIIRRLGNNSKRFSAIIYNSALSRKQHESLGYSSLNASVLPNGFDCRQFSPDEDQRKQSRKALMVSDNELLFGHIARYHPMKNHLGLIEAFSKLTEKHPSGKLLLIGRDVNKENQQLIQEIKRVGLEDRILLLGERNDIPALLNGMDYLVSPSLWGEGFPNVIGEAMACGTPCIATDVGDSAFVINDAGFVVPPGNAEAMAAAMIQAAQHTPEMQTQLGNKARQRILDHFRQEMIAESYEAIYLRLVNRPTSK